MAATPEHLQGLLNAGQTAVTKVDGTVTSIEEEDHGARWEVHVVTSDGTEHEVDLSADGRTVLRGPTKEHDDAADKAKHRKRVAAAKINYRQAAQAMAAAVPGGRVTELDLDGHRGTTVWEGGVIDGSGTKHEVRLDSASGSVLQNRPDH